MYNFSLCTRCGSLSCIYGDVCGVCRSVFWCSSGANLNDVPVLNHCSKQLFVLRVILLLLQVGGMLESKR